MALSSLAPALAPAVADVVSPQKVPLTTNQHDLIFFSVVVAGFALFAHFLYNWNSTGEVSSKYRPAVLASLCIAGIAALSYLIIGVKIDSGYDFTGGQYVPNPEALFSLVPRYMDWAVTVPLLMVELFAVSTVTGRARSGARTTAIAASVAMIVTGYLGAQVFAEGTSTFYRWLWWAISMACFVVIYAVVVPVIIKTVRDLPREAGRAYGLGSTLLLVTFLVYPIVYLIPLVASGGWWTTSMQVAYSIADITAKVGFGMLIHKVAKLRTAHDLAMGEDTHPEPIWIDGVHHSDGLQPAQRPFDPRELFDESLRARHGDREHAYTGADAGRRDR